MAAERVSMVLKMATGAEVPASIQKCSTCDQQAAKGKCPILDLKRTIESSRTLDIQELSDTSGIVYKGWNSADGGDTRRYRFECHRSKDCGAIEIDLQAKYFF